MLSQVCLSLEMKAHAIQACEADERWKGAFCPNMNGFVSIVQGIVYVVYVVVCCIL